MFSPGPCAEILPRLDAHTVLDPQPTRVVVAANAPLTRIGLRAMLEQDSTLEVVGEAATHDELVPICRSFLPDLVIVDVLLTGLDVCVAKRAVREASPHVRLVLLSSDETPVSREHVLALGAEAVVYISATGRELRAVLRTALASNT